jgi:hypothetical protein
VTYDGQTGGLHVVDVRNPNAPRVAKTLPFNVKTMAVVTSIVLKAVFVMVENGVRGFDVTDPFDPVLVDSGSHLGILNLAASGSSLYMSNGSTVKDTKYQSMLPPVKTADNYRFSASKIEADASHVYAGSGRWVTIRSASDPMTVLDELLVSGRVWAMSDDGDLLVVADDTETLTIIQVPNIQLPN